MKKYGHLILMFVTLLMAAGCIFLIPRVNVNSDMTKYLPDHSRMKQGIEILTTNFGEAQLNNANVKVMFSHLTNEERQQIATELGSLDEVNGVSYTISKDSVYTKYDLLVPANIDQKSFGYSVRSEYGDDVIVETSQDGATPPFSALAIAGALILIILLVMSQSWLEPVIYLIAIGVAVIINIGTNALLPSVSITTNYIVAILQLVLSLDYAIVLSNRFRQEICPERTLVEAMNRSIRKASAAILSSALTTVVGLIMLAFMRVKIGLDLGVVLAKGVVCSLMTTFTLLPSLLLIFHKAIVRTEKRTFIVPTDRLGWFATHHKISLAIASVLLFGVAFYYSRQTEISFSTNGESKIEKIFPKTNTIVTLYHTDEENAVFALSDSLKQDSNVMAVISYPTLLKQPYTAEGLVTYIRQMSVDMADYMPEMDLSILNAETMHIVYYMRSHAADTLRIGFPDLMKFVQDHCLTNPMFEQLISKEMRQQMDLLQTMMEPEEEEVTQTKTATKTQTQTPTPQAQTGRKASNVDANADVNQLTQTKAKAKVNAGATNAVPVNAVMRRLASFNGDELTYYLMTLTDSVELYTEKSVRQMADYIGSTNGQTKMVYSFSKNGKRMTPLEYVHFLTDDLFQRKALAKLVNEEQKKGLQLRVQLMDAAATGTPMPADEMSSVLTQLGVRNASANHLLALAGKKQVQEKEVEVAVVEDTESKPDTTAVVVAQPVKHRKSRAELQAERFDQLMYGGKKYTSEQMAKHFKYLGQSIEPETVNMLYCYYGSINHYNDSLVMSPEQLLAYVTDTLIHLDIVSAFLDTTTIQLLDSTQQQLSQAMDMLSHEDYSMMIALTSLPDESEETYAFIDQMDEWLDEAFDESYYMIGESVMFSELKDGFNQEMTMVTLLTILAIFIIVAITFRSIIVPSILVMTVMTAVYVNVIVSGLASGQMLYLAYLIVQSILMGATIDYGILYATYYKANRKTMEKYEAAREAYHGSIRTIMTSGLIMVLGPGVMALLVDDVTISAIVGCISVGAAVAILLILFVLPGVLVACDKLVTSKKIRSREEK
ncbi:MAG: MMPL family transporter [Bacteroidales bacterium]|nr:MMPL family transporter [Candidatus Colicola equi]